MGNAVRIGIKKYCIRLDKRISAVYNLIIRKRLGKEGVHIGRTCRERRQVGKPQYRDVEAVFSVLLFLDREYGSVVEQKSILRRMSALTA